MAQNISNFNKPLADGNDIRIGGAPQPVGIGNKGPCRNFGVITDAGTHFQGRAVSTKLSTDVQWRNSEFERVDQDGRLLNGAQRHARERRKMLAGTS